jgi:putative tryptophan/tyrosine transport system substrate-binding protein
MRRREFIVLIGGAAAAPVLSPLTARAQQAAIPVIGYLGSASPDAWQGRLQAFRQGLSEAGFDEGRNVAIEYRWAEDHYDRLQALAADLVARGVSVLVTPGSAPAALIAKAATTTIPIVFETGADPVVAGLVGSLSRPGGNITGVTALAFELGPKRLELLHEIVPSAKAVATIVNPTGGDVIARQTRDLQAAAQKLGLDLLVLEASTDGDIDTAFATLRAQRPGGLVVIPDVFTNSRATQLAAMALRSEVPAIFQSREFVSAGGLMSYGADIAESHRLAGTYVGRILKGEKPADLPVMQATKVEMFVNLKTAKAIGVTIPLALLGRAEEVIE